jgi:hypothetical protein
MFPGFRAGFSGNTEKTGDLVVAHELHIQSVTEK